MLRFRNRYRIPSARKPGWDYGTPVWYFVTVCTRNRVSCLSRIVQGELVLTEAGQVAANQWVNIGRHHEDVALDAWVIMPDHVHGLIRPATSPLAGTGPGHALATKAEAWRPGVLGVLVNHFKRTVTGMVRRRNIPWPGWQPRFHDRILPDDNALHAVRRYIAMNPARYVARNGHRNAGSTP